MARSRSRFFTALLLSPLIGSGLLVSCSAANYSESATRAPADVAVEGSAAGFDTLKAQAGEGGAVSNVPRQLPQLIKRAEMVLTVETPVAEVVQAVSKVIKTHQGDVLSLRDRLPANPSQRQVATFQLRVPQAKLDQVLEELATLGDVQSRAITAEDVSSQLVDFQARLTNLRSSEERVRKIMDRSGSVADVLKVSQELSNIRSSIEQIDAQLQRLKNQVAFSTIALTIQDAIASNARQPSLGGQMADTWTHATRAVSGLTTTLLALGLWLVAFSPYVIGLLVMGWLGKRFLLPKLPQKQPPLLEDRSQN